MNMGEVWATLAVEAGAQDVWWSPGLLLLAHVCIVYTLRIEYPYPSQGKEYWCKRRQITGDGCGLGLPVQKLPVGFAISQKSKVLFSPGCGKLM